MIAYIIESKENNFFKGNIKINNIKIDEKEVFICRFNYSKLNKISVKRVKKALNFLKSRGVIFAVFDDEFKYKNLFLKSGFLTNNFNYIFKNNILKIIQNEYRTNKILLYNPPCEAKIISFMNICDNCYIYKEASDYDDIEYELLYEFGKPLKILNENDNKFDLVICFDKNYNLKFDASIIIDYENQTEYHKKLKVYFKNKYKNIFTDENINYDFIEILNFLGYNIKSIAKIYGINI